ncbi:hypothetical protein HDK77DRAFT_368898 [Phyllosticta capitalensis]|uniref:Conidiation-specific protein 10 n=1 Tax=Phyllosticta capitalensis TaxID=121624 RepID=A0ABR1YXW3_9PEZI
MSANTNPGNFANRPTEEVQEIAHKGGVVANHPVSAEEHAPPGRNLDGTFMKGSHAAKEAGHVGGLHAHGEAATADCMYQAEGESGRRDDGTFLKGSEEAKEAGHKGGIH